MTKGADVTGILANKVALISGTGGGQGRAAALHFAEEGAIVVGCDVNADANRETVKLVVAAGGIMTAPADALDLSTSKGAQAWIDSAIADHGRIDVLYNNASAPRLAPIDKLSDEDWYFTLRNELDIVFFPTRAAWPHLAVRGGVIINIGSISGWALHSGSGQSA
jgi:NAD(P)-dependent dehydrogenase (short-subunit alcohol dehydrogenase family)